MTTFAVTDSGQLIDSVNYLLSNLDTGNATGNVSIPVGTLIANVTTGQITPYQTGGNTYSYLNQYVNLRYSNNASGTDGFSTVPTNYNYFGIYNSAGPTPSSNPAAYQWQQVSGGFGTTKTIYYSSLGGRQVQWAAASSPPSSNFVVSTANVAIDLDVVTTAAGTPGERGPLAMAYVITTADPTSASSSTLTGWFEASRSASTPPIGTGLTPVAGDTAYFTYPATATSVTYTFNGSTWNTAEGQVVSGATIVPNTLNGNTLVTATVAGSAIVPQGITSTQIADSTITYVQIGANTIIADNIQASTITGSKIATGTLTANNIAAGTITSTQIAAGTITANNIAAGTITASQIAANTITATQISSDYIYAGNIVSNGATLGSLASPGYWLRYTDGAARFGGNVSIGNSLSIGANAQIGGNLTVSGLISSGALNTNTVQTTTMVSNAVTNSVGTSRNSNVTIGTQSGGTVPNGGYGLSLCEQITVSVPSGVGTPGVFIYGGASVYASWTGGTVPVQSFVYKLNRRINGSGAIWDTMYLQPGQFNSPAIARDTPSIAFYDSTVVPGTTYDYFLGVYMLQSTSSPSTTTTFSSSYNSIFAQVIKR